jgi:nucleoside-diphosphate-sugar epimerase
MNILILGSEGQIGKHLFDYFKKKYKVFSFDLINSNSDDLRKYKNKKLKSLIKKSDFVFFLAFDVGGSKYLKNYQYSHNFLMNNVAIMKNTFEELAIYKKKFIFATSQMSNMSHSPYGTLKRIGEYLTQSLECISVKFWNVYGIENDKKKNHVITDFILKGLRSNFVKMETNGLEKRDFLYADDCCNALEKIMINFNKFKSKKIIDLYSGKFVSIRCVAKIISKNFLSHGKKVKFIPNKNITDNLQNNVMNKGDGFFFRYWKPKYSLDRGVKKIFEHYIK